jgi:hypothetical protein
LSRVFELGSQGVFDLAVDNQGLYAIL